MSTDFVDVAGGLAAIEETKLLSGPGVVTESPKLLGEACVVIDKTRHNAIAVASAGVEDDVYNMRVADWGPPPDEGGSELFGFLAKTHTLTFHLRNLHGALSALTRGTVNIKFFDIALKDTLDEVLHARARTEESWSEEAVRFHRSAPPSRAWRTFEELARWMGIGKVRTANVLGISRGTTNAWKAGREPQPANARRLYRTHTIIKTLVRRLGLEETRSWLETGDPSPLELLAAGDFGAVDRAASALVFVGGEQESERVGAFIPEPGEGGVAAERSPSEAKPPKRVRRRAPTRRRAR